MLNVIFQAQTHNYPRIRPILYGFKKSSCEFLQLPSVEMG